MGRSIEAISSSASTNDMWFADEQRAAGFRNVFAAFDANAINGMRRHPQHEAHQRIRQQADRVTGGNKRQNRAIEENSGGRLMKHNRESVIRARGEEDSDEGDQIRRRDHAALLLRPRPVLNQSVERHARSNPAEKSEQQRRCSSDERTSKRIGAGAVKQRAEDRHAQRAERNQPIFDFSAGEIPGGKAAESNANGDRGLQIADMRVVDMQHVVAVDRRSVNCRSAAKKTEIRVAEHRPAEHAIGANRASNARQNRPADSSGNVFLGSPAGTREIPRLVSQPDHRAAEEQQARHSFAAVVAFGQNSRRPSCARMPARNVPNSMMPLPQESRRSGRSSGSRPYFEGPNSAPSVLIRKTAGAFQRKVAQRQARDEKRHHADFEEFRADGHAALAVAVREDSRRPSKKE